MQETEDLERLTDAMLSTSRVLVAIAAHSLAESSESLTLPQHRALVVLHSRGPQSVQELATALRVAPSSATRLCDRLVSKGLIHRTPASDDRREVRLSVSDEGARIVGAVSRRRRRELRRVVGEMRPASRSTLVRALEEFSRAAGEVPEDEWYLGWA